MFQDILVIYGTKTVKCMGFINTHSIMLRTTNKENGLHNTSGP